MEKYSVVITTSAIKELEAIDRKGDRQRIVRAMQALAENPRAPGCEKLAGPEGRYRKRVGSYRVVYAVHDTRQLVDVVKIGTAARSIGSPFRGSSALTSDILSS